MFNLSVIKIRQRHMLQFIGGCLCLSAAYAGGEEVIPVAPVTLFPTTPGVSLYGLGGNGWTATGDVMAPIVGRPLNFTYIDPQIYYHNSPDDYTGSVGLGQRWLTDRAGILGAYVFGDYNHLNNGNSFWFVSPGIERLGEVFDVSLNGYIPVSNQRRNNDIVFADQLGNFNNITFAGHTQYDTLVQTFDSTGWGLDGEIGVRLPWQDIKIYMGGYYFSPKNNSNIGGGAIRAEVPINNYLSVALSEAYDSEFHNTLKGGVTVWFGGRHTRFNGDLATRIVDPIQRNLVAIAGGAHTAQPVLSGTEDAGTAVELTNISFFIPAGSVPPTNGMLASAVVAGAVGDGTFENPYRGITQPNVNDGNAQNNRIFYINSGTYQAQYDANINPDFIVLNNDALFGRTNGFKQEAFDGSRPLIIFSQSGFQAPPGDSNDSLNDLQLAGSGSGVGVFINHDLTDNLFISNMNASMNGLNITRFGDGIDIMNGDSSRINPGIGSAMVSITNSVIENNTGQGGAMTLPSAPTRGASGGIAGINYGNQLTINVNQVTVANNTLDNVDQLAAAGGIVVVNMPPLTGLLSLNVNQATISNNATPACGVGICDNIFWVAGGIAAANNPRFTDSQNEMSITVNNSKISNQMILNSAAGEAVGGIALQSNSNDLATLNVNNSEITNNVTSNRENGIASGGIAVSNDLAGPIVVNIANSTIGGNQSFSALSAGGIGIFMNTAGSIILNVKNSAILDNNSRVDFSFPAENTAGGIAAFDNGGHLVVNVTGSKVSGNTGSGGAVTGGIAISNDSNSGIVQTTVTGSTITNNEGTDGTMGGIALANTQANATSTLLVSNSTISGNQEAGVSALRTAGNLAAIIDSSSVFNNTVGLNMDGAGVIAVTRPVFFDGVVNFSGGGVVTFPNVTPNNGDTVICPLNTGVCYIQ